MNISRSFVTYLEGLGYGTFGTDIFIGGVPVEAPDPCFWVLSAGGATERKNVTGGRVKRDLVALFYRNTDGGDVYETLQALEEEINKKQCTELADYDTVEMEATAFPTDQDLDVDDRTVGLLQVTITTYQDEDV